MRTAYIVFLVFLVVFSARSQNDNIKFETISLEQGLSQGTVSSIAQDHIGFLWFATEAGLHKYNGYDFDYYVDDSNDSTSISNHYVNCIHIDSKDQMWVGTEEGLNRYVYEKDEFIQYKATGDSNTLSNNKVYCITSDKHGNLWIGTADGICKYIPSENRFIPYLSNSGGHTSLNHNRINTLYIDSDNKIWIGTNGSGLCVAEMPKENEKHLIIKQYKTSEDDIGGLNSNTIKSIIRDQTGVLWVGTDFGLYKFNDATKKFKSYLSNPNNENSLVNNKVFAIKQINTNELWIGTDAGLSIFNIKTGEFKNYIHDLTVLDGLSDNRIFTIFEDNSGIIWVGTYAGGVCKYDGRSNKFKTLSHKHNTDNCLNFNHIRPILEDDQGRLWIGTDGGGINCYDRKENKFAYITHEPGNPNSLSSNKIFAFHIDKKGNYWIGTYEKGLNIYSPSEKQFYLFRSDSTDENSLSNDLVRVIAEDKNNVFWIATNNGLNKFIPGESFNDKPQIKRYLHDPDKSNSLVYDRIYEMVLDSDGIIWIGTMGGGISRFDPETEVFTTYKVNDATPNGLNNDFIVSMLDNNDGLLWIGTHGGGLNCLEKKTGVFKYYTTKNGLPDNTVYAVLSDDNGNFWLSSNKGISRFNPETNEVKRYDISDGLQGYEFNGGSCYKSPSGEFFFGGTKGLNYFYPDSIKDNMNKPSIVITDFLIYNKTIRVGEKINDRIILKKPIEQTTEIVLHHTEAIISFEMTALDYADPMRNDYAYMMENFEKEWNHVGHRRFASYTNLPPGNYIFRVKGANCDGIWNEEGTSIKIKVLPPWWKTVWFYIIVAGILIALVITYIKGRERKLRKDKKLLEYEVLNRTVEIEKQKEEIKATADHLAEVNTKLEKLSIVASKTANAISIFDVAGNIEFRNDAFWKLYRDILGEIVLNVGQNISELDQAHVVHEHFRNCVETKSPVNFTCSKSFDSGEVFWIQSTLTPVIGMEGEVTNVVSIDSDITETKRAEEIIKKQSNELEKLSIVASQTDNAVIIADAEGRIEYTNNSFTRMTGYTIEEFKEQCSNSLYNAMTRGEIIEDLRDNVQKGKTTVYYAQTKTKSDESIWVQTTITPFFDDNNELSKLIVIESDIDKLKKAEQEIKLKNIQITDSIKYAEQIQQSILPSEDQFRLLFPDSFVLFMPRDIVSGDFYWVSEQQNKIFVAVCDCTGHGVPGGFMSMMGNALLNQIVNENSIYKPSEILNQLNLGVVNALNQKDDNEQSDGMDISLCCIDKEANEITIAGANHIIFVLKEDEINTVEGDIYSIGGMQYLTEEISFKDNYFKIDEELTIYMFTDGYQDQFGGENNLKYMSGKFKDLLLDTSQLQLNEQHQLLVKTFNDWKGEYRQIDDVLVIGIKVNLLLTNS